MNESNTEKELEPVTAKLQSDKTVDVPLGKDASSISNISTKDVEYISESKPDFNTIYDELHGKFPEIININRPALLAIGIRKEMSKETGVSNVILKRWIAWYCQKSNYYSQHKQGATRFNLNGSEAGIVTEKHQKKWTVSLRKQ